MNKMRDDLEHGWITSGRNPFITIEEKHPECTVCESQDYDLHEYDGILLCDKCWAEQVIDDYNCVESEVDFIQRCFSDKTCGYESEKNFFEHLGYYATDCVGGSEFRDWLLNAFKSNPTDPVRKFLFDYCVDEYIDKSEFAEYLVNQKRKGNLL